MVNIADEKRKILDGTYPSRVIMGRQNKHIEGTIEFEQKCEQMEQISPGSMPAVIIVDAQTLVNKYKGTGSLYFHPSSPDYPREDITADKTIGKTWVKSLKKYINTSAFTIYYSKTGVHIIPVNEKGRI